MTAPERRRPLPALAFIAALTVLTALVWFRVIHRHDTGASAASPSCSSSSSAPPVAKPKVLPAPSKITVAVLNSTQRNGLATQTKKLLQSRGFRVSLADDDSPAYGGHGVIKGVGEIRYGPQSLPAATLLHYYLPRATMVATDSSSTSVSLAVGATYKTLRSTADVLKSLKAANLRVTQGALPSATPSASSTCSSPA